LIRHCATSLLCLLTLACTPSGDAVQLAQYQSFTERPKGVGCVANIAGPAVTEIISETILVEPAQIGPDGVETRPAIYRKITRPQTINEGSGTWFMRVCDVELTPDVIATLQRALSARGAYRGFATGQMDARTMRAIQSYQAARGLDSAQVSVEMLVEFGLLQGPSPAPAQ
jgi:hypothetical protein